MADIEIRLSELDLRRLMQGVQIVFGGPFVTVSIEENEDLYVSEMEVTEL